MLQLLALLPDWNWSSTIVLLFDHTLLQSLCIVDSIKPFRQPVVVENRAVVFPCYSDCFLFGMWSGLLSNMHLLENCLLHPPSLLVNPLNLRSMWLRQQLWEGSNCFMLIVCVHHCIIVSREGDEEVEKNNEARAWKVKCTRIISRGTDS